MSEKIIGECNTATFRDIEHLLDVYGTEAYDPSTLEKKHHLALALVAGLVSAGIPFTDCLLIRRVLFWEHHMEFKFQHCEKARALKAKLSTPAVNRSIMDTMARVLGLKR